MVVLLLVGCGGGGSTPPPPPPPPEISVTLTCVDHIQIAVTSANYTCAPTVSNTTNTAVTWSVDNSALATVANGVLTPNSTTTGTVKVTATSAADTTKSASVTVNVVDWILLDLPLAYTGIISSDGTGATTILSLPESSTGGCFNADWMADHLSFVCASDIGNYFFIYRTNGAAGGATLTTQVGVPSLGAPNSPSPSPDGKSLVFIAIDGTKGAEGVYKINVDGSGLQLLDQEASCSGACPGIDQARYSFDGTKIVYTHLEGLQTYICVMNADGTNKSCLVAGHNGAFSKDGTTIFFTASDGVHSISVNGGTASSLIVAGSNAISSPNGLKLVFETSTGISTAYVDGSGQQLLVGSAHLGSW